MIKEWCAKCKGSGLSITPMSQCGKCNGMGYTELEPESIFESGAIKTNQTITLSGGYKKYEVYIKELKE